MIDRILYNGRIYTMHPSKPVVQALAIAGDKVVATGSSDSISRLATSETRVENLDGRAVIPGLIDAHIHWEWVSRALRQIDLFEVPDKDIALERVQQRVSQTPAGEWLGGRGWTQDLWGGVFPTRYDLDAVAPDNPAYFQAKSGHAAWVNSRALEIAGITAETDDPPGGEIVRDEHGNPTGILLELAMELVAQHVPEPAADALADAMLDAQNLALSSGLTGIHDFDDPTCLAALQVVRERGELGLRVVKQINREWLDHALALGIRGGFGDHWLRFGGLKLFADGALGPRTAWMVEPYSDSPNNRGIRLLDVEEMTGLAGRASAAGLPTAIHAIGDQAVHDVLNAFEVVRQQEAASGILRDQRRHRIEHVQIIHPQDLNRLAELDIIASMQPRHATSDWQFADSAWGERSRYAYNPRLQLDRNVPVAFGSDAPIESLNPIEGIYAAVTRQDFNGQPEGGWYPDARLSVEEAVHGFTVGAAYAGGMEDVQGCLAPNYLADLVVLDRDIFTIEPAEIKDSQVVGTMVGGEWRYGGLD